MKILITYHNFVRDYRGSLLLAAALNHLGHKTFIWPAWNNAISYAIDLDVDVIVAGQTAEISTSLIGDYCRENEVHLVINSSEPFPGEKTAKNLFVHRGEDLNSNFISLQNIGCDNSWAELFKNDQIIRKDLYKFLGVPRFDLSADLKLRRCESPILEKKYAGKLKKGKIYLYLSSFLFAEAFQGLPPDDIIRYRYDELAKQNHEEWMHVSSILKTFVSRHFNDGDVLWLKKHPWDMSCRIDESLRGYPVQILCSSEYVVPCMDCADVVMHSFSTSAIEAWTMDKPTVSVGRQSMFANLDLPYTGHELIANDADELWELANNKESMLSKKKFLVTFLGGQNDGLATQRMALEISKLQTLKHRTLKRKLNIRGKIKASKLRLTLTNPVPSDSQKQKIMRSWELQASHLRNIYGPAIRSYIKNAFSC